MDKDGIFEKENGRPASALDSKREFGEEIALLVFTFVGMLARNPFLHHHQSSTTVLCKAKLETFLLSVLIGLHGNIAWE